MLRIDNDNTYCEVIRDETNIDKYNVKLLDDLTIDSDDTEYNLDTGISITLTEDYDEVFVKGNISDTYRLYTDSFIIKKGDEQKLVLKLANPLNQEIVLEKGSSLCKIYKAFSDNNIIDAAHAAGINIFCDGVISAKSLDGLTRKFEIVTPVEEDKKLIIDFAPMDEETE